MLTRYRSCWPTKRDKCQVSVAKANALHTNFKQVMPREGGRVRLRAKTDTEKSQTQIGQKRDVFGEKWDDSMCFCLFTHDCITCALTAWSLIHILTFQILFVLHSNIVTSCWKCLKLIDEKWIISPGIGKNQCRNCSPVETWVAKSALRIAVICAYSKIQN